MDPLTILTAAIAAGASCLTKSKKTGELKETYESLKRSMASLFEPAPKVLKVLRLLEENPSSTARRMMLEEEIMNVSIDAERLSELISKANALLNILEQEGYTASATGSGAIALGDSAKAVGRGGVSIGGDVRGSVIITGDGNAVTAPKPWPRKKK